MTAKLEIHIYPAGQPFAMTCVTLIRNGRPSSSTTLADPSHERATQCAAQMQRDYSYVDWNARECVEPVIVDHWYPPKFQPRAA